MAYTSTVHTIVNPAKFFKSTLDHVVHTGLIGDVNLHRYRLERGILGALFAFFGSGQGTFFVDVRQSHAFGSGFGKGEGCFFANAAGGLKEPN